LIIKKGKRNTIIPTTTKISFFLNFILFKKNKNERKRTEFEINSIPNERRKKNKR
jgi:hypothetical protein